MKNYTIHISLVTPDGEEHEHSDYLRFASGRDAVIRAKTWAREVAREIGARVVDAYAYDDAGCLV
jgi:nucleotide-binding universal stress UspA family protein